MQDALKAMKEHQEKEADKKVLAKENEVVHFSSKILSFSFVIYAHDIWILFFNCCIRLYYEYHNILSTNL